MFKLGDEVLFNCSRVKKPRLAIIVAIPKDDDETPYFIRFKEKGTGHELRDRLHEVRVYKKVAKEII